MRLSGITWTDTDVEHIARHGVTPEEIEEVLTSRPLWRRGRKHPRSRRTSVYALGRTEAGRYLFVVLSPLARGRARCVTARDMDTRARRFYDRHRR